MLEVCDSFFESTAGTLVPEEAAFQIGLVDLGLDQLIRPAPLLFEYAS